MSLERPHQHSNTLGTYVVASNVEGFEGEGVFEWGRQLCGGKGGGCSERGVGFGGMFGGRSDVGLCIGCGGCA